MVMGPSMFSTTSVILVANLVIELVTGFHNFLVNVLVDVILSIDFVMT